MPQLMLKGKGSALGISIGQGCFEDRQQGNRIGAVLFQQILGAPGHAGPCSHHLVDRMHLTAGLAKRVIGVGKEPIIEIFDLVLILVLIGGV